MIQISDVPTEFIQDAEDIFREYAETDDTEDELCSYHLSFPNFVKACKELMGDVLNEREMKEAFEDMDVDHHACTEELHNIHIGEFIRHCYFQHTRQQDDRVYELVVEKLDSDHKGFIDIKSLKQTIKNQTRRALSEETASILNKMKNSKDQIPVMDFIQKMENLEPAAKEAKKPAAEILTKKSSSHA
jgi:Ca2+-binding EF-hand superfamily protein